MGNCCRKTSTGRKHTTRAALVYQSAVSLLDMKGLEGFAGLPLASAQSPQVASSLASPLVPCPAALSASSSSVSESDLPVGSIHTPPAMLQRPKAVPRLNLCFATGQPEPIPQIKIEEGSGSPMSKRRDGGVSLSVSSSSVEGNQAGSSSVQSKLDCSVFAASSDTKSLQVDRSQADSLTGPPKVPSPQQTESYLTAEEPILSHAVSLKLPAFSQASEASTQTFRHTLTSRVKCTSTLTITSTGSQVRLNDYTIVSELSTSELRGTWYIAEKDSLKYTMWEYAKGHSAGEYTPLWLRTQVGLLDRLNHPHILQLLEVIDSPEDEIGYFIYEATEGFLPATGLSQPCIQHLFQGLIQAVDYLHREALVVHLNIRPEALFWVGGEVKVGDFGMAQSVRDSEDTYRRAEMGVESLAPEGWGGAKKLFRTRPADIWACGVTLYRLLFNSPPFPCSSLQSFLSQVRSDQYFPPRLHFPEDTNPVLRDLLQAMLKKEPRERARIEELVGHPWLREDCSIQLV